VTSILILFIWSQRPDLRKSVSRDAVIKGKPCDARCKFRYILNFTAALRGFCVTARLSCRSLSADCMQWTICQKVISTRKNQSDRIFKLTQTWPHSYSTLILGTFPLDQITHIGGQSQQVRCNAIQLWNFFRSIPFYVITLPERQTDTRTDGQKTYRDITTL